MSRISITNKTEGRCPAFDIDVGKGCIYNGKVYQRIAYNEYIKMVFDPETGNLPFLNEDAQIVPICVTTRVLPLSLSWEIDYGKRRG